MIRVGLPVSRVLRHERRPSLRDVQAASATHSTAVPVPARHEAAPIDGGPPNIDVQRLTDQVVRAIDRRVTAYRERMGRS